MSHNHHDGQASETHFYRGLFFGVLMGVGIAYFLKTKDGQELKQELFGKGENLIDEVSNRVIEFLEESPTP